MKTTYNVNYRIFREISDKWVLISQKTFRGYESPEEVKDNSKKDLEKLLDKSNITSVKQVLYVEASIEEVNEQLDIEYFDSEEFEISVKDKKILEFLV